MEKVLQGQATPDQIAEWKKQHGKVFEYKVDDMVCYLKPVSRDLYSLASSKISTSPAKFTETIISGIWLGGCDTIKDDDRYYFGLVDYVEEFMAKKKGSLGEL